MTERICLPPRKLSWRKRGLFSTLIALGLVAIIELASLLAVFLLHGSYEALLTRRHGVADRDPFVPPADYARPVMIHPYIGMVLQPKDDAGQLTVDGKLRTTEFGFVDNGSPIHRRSNDRVIVGIVGGSVAMQFATNATGVLEQELSDLPQFAGRSFEFVRLAIGGYKQPQQLMTINYLLALGAEFDIVINLDGVNESALPKTDNVRFGVSAAYPRKWGTMIAVSGSMEVSRMVGYVAYLRQQQSETAQFFNAIPICYSPTALLIWQSLNHRSDLLIQRQIGEVSAKSKKELSYCASGPPEHFESDEQLYQHCVDIWARSSIQLHRVCMANGIQYFHFLQPNQYVANTKPIGKVESAIALSEESPFRIPVIQCFPMMQARSVDMAKAGVAFTDLTRVFSDHPEQIYKDTCCHVLDDGDKIMGNTIATHIKQFYLRDGQ
jgi:hypothetical protein